MVADDAQLIANRNLDGDSHDPDVTGWKGSDAYFRFVGCDAILPSLIVDVLRGRYLGAIFRNVVPATTRQSLIANFVASPGRVRRGADAPGEYLGAYHWNKTIDEYFDQADAVKADLTAALDVPSEPLRVLRRQLADQLALFGVELRPACHHGREASAGIFRSWMGKGNFAVVPHEDRGQCENPKQSGFEIQQVARHHIIGLNICLSNGSGGRLIAWNVRPDQATRKRLGVHHTGSPYAAEWLAGIDQLFLDIRPGDIYLLNASHVHAVEPIRDTDARRVTLSQILGFADDKTVISWT